VLNGILWVLRTALLGTICPTLSTLSNLPSPLPTVAARRHADSAVARAGRDLRARGKLDLSETFIDASFSSAKKGALLAARLAEERQ